MGAISRSPIRLYLGTEDGLRTVELTDEGVRTTGSVLREEAVRAVSVHPDDADDAYVGCGLRGWGLYHTSDGGATVESLDFEDRWVWGVARDPTDPDTVYVGTEPPALYVSTDGGATFDPLDGVDEVPSRPDWTFFHDPFHAGHVHGIAVHPERPDRIFAGVEHGAVLVSTDGGETWDDALVGRDVHRVAVDPSDPDRVFAATGSGLYRSDEAGTEWEHVDDLNDLYCHAIVFDADDPTRLYVYAASDDRPLHRSDDGGDSWTPIGDGLPATRAADPLGQHRADPDTLVYAGDTDDERSHLYVSTDAGATWERIGPTFPKVWRLAVAPDS